MIIVLLTLLDSRLWLADLILLNQIIQCAAGLIFVLSYLAAEMLLRCIGENEETVVESISSLPISEASKEQFSEQMHCIAQYYRERIKR